MLGHSTHFRRKLLSWYHQNRRDLPWRIPRHDSKTPSTTPDPYLVLLSEAMLQQTQVATVIPYFLRFIKSFPTLTHLANATEQDVLRHWQGLGYYSRARNLLATSKILTSQNPDPTIPQTVEELMKLPGIGRYTAGAIASIAFNQRAPILDGNVTRVISRLDLLRDPAPVGCASAHHRKRCAEAHPANTPSKELLWRRAAELLPKTNCGHFNSALMELGATICTPRNPKCLLCPVQSHCAANAAGIQDQIPPPAAKKTRPLERRLTLAISHKEEFLLEQRPSTGRWANMWQFVTIKSPRKLPTPAELSKIVGLKLSSLRQIGALQHDLTHRHYHFRVFACRSATRPTDLPPSRRWVGLSGLSDFPLPRPQLEVAKMISSLTKRKAAPEIRHFLPPEQKSPLDLADPFLDEV